MRKNDVFIQWSHTGFAKDTKAWIGIDGESNVVYCLTDMMKNERPEDAQIFREISELPALCETIDDDWPLNLPEKVDYRWARTSIETEDAPEQNWLDVTAGPNADMEAANWFLLEALLEVYKDGSDFPYIADYDDLVERELIARGVTNPDVKKALDMEMMDTFVRIVPGVEDISLEVDHSLILSLYANMRGSLTKNLDVVATALEKTLKNYTLAIHHGQLELSPERYERILSTYNQLSDALEPGMSPFLRGRFLKGRAEDFAIAYRDANHSENVPSGMGAR